MSNIRSKIEYDNNNKQFRETRRQQLLQSRRDIMNQNCFNGMEVEKTELFQAICMVFNIIDSFFNSANFEYDFINYFTLMCGSNEDFLTSKSFGPNPDFQVFDSFEDIYINDDDENYQKCFDDETIYQLPKNSVSIQYIEQYLNQKHLQYTLKNIIEALTIMLIEIYVIASKGYNINLEHLKNLTCQLIKINS